MALRVNWQAVAAIAAVTSALVAALAFLAAYLADGGGESTVIALTRTASPVSSTARPNPSTTPTAKPPLEPTRTQPPIPTARATPTPASIPVDASPPGTVLYSADWSSSTGWLMAYGWSTLDGSLVNDGTNSDSRNWVAAPYSPGVNAVRDYAVEIEVRLIARPSCRGVIGLVARDGYVGGIRTIGTNCMHIWRGDDYAYIGLAAQDLGTNGRPPIEKALNLDELWHTYRLEVRSNAITLLFDGAVMVTLNDNRFLSSGGVGVVAADTQVEVRSFRVIKL